MTERPAFGHCDCGAEGTHLVWNKAGTVGTFTCLPHLPFVQKENRGGRTERMD